MNVITDKQGTDVQNLPEKTSLFPFADADN
jgi:hypothetical protein